jgi:hypothetical protein
VSSSHPSVPLDVARGFTLKDENCDAETQYDRQIASAPELLDREEQHCSNGNVVRAINKFSGPPGKDVGQGLNIAFETVRSPRPKAPVISELYSSVLVQISHEKLASAKGSIMEYLENNSMISNRG